MIAFQNAGVKLFLVSHHHSGQFGIAQYKTGDDEEYTMASARANGGPRKNEVKPDKFDYSNDASEAIDETGYYPLTNSDDFYYKNEDENFAHRTHNKGNAGVWIDRTDDVLGKDNSITINKNKTSYILQVVLGNGGRVLDGLFSDRFSDLVTLYAQSGEDNHGYATAKFTKDKCELKYKYVTATGLDDKKITINLGDEDDDLTSKLQPYYYKKIKCEDTTLVPSTNECHSTSSSRRRKKMKLR